MATIQAGGIGSGIEINKLVEQLVEAERAGPTSILDTRQERAEITITALASLKTSLSNFTSALDKLNNLEEFQARTATSSQPSLFTATANSDATNGVYNVKVKNLAVAHKLASKSFDQTVSEIGRGTLTIQVGNESMNLTISGANDTVAEIRDAINNASSNPGVTASLINVDDGEGGFDTRLVLVSDRTGTSNGITISVTGDEDGNDTDDSGLSQLINANMADLEVAEDALIEIEGFEFTSSSNSVNGAIQGVSLELKSIDENVVATVTVSHDTTKAKEHVQTFVDSYNNLFATMKLLGNASEEEGRLGNLIGDPTLRTIQSRVRQAISTTVDSASSQFNTLASIGITTEKDGQLVLNTVSLDKVLTSNFDDVGELFASEEGYANNLSDLISAYIDSNGVLETRKTSLSQKLDAIALEREDLDRRLDKIEQRLLEQFTAMDILVSNLNSTSNFLSQQFNLLNNQSKGK